MTVRGIGFLVAAGLVLAPHLARAEVSLVKQEDVSEAAALADPEEDCFDYVHQAASYAPYAASVDGALRSGHVIVLDLVLVLDGITKARAREVMAVVAESYAEMNIEVRIVDTRKTRFAGEPPRTGDQTPTADVIRLMRDLKASVGGVRPSGSDVVHLLTGKDIYIEDSQGRAYALAGMADCIGGVRYARRAFSVSEGTGEYDAIGSEMAGIIATHEVGHVMDAMHESANCFEGAPLERYGRKTPCTAMWPYVISMNAGNFGTVERSVIRGSAEEFASP